MEDEPVRARVEILGETCTSVVVGAGLGHEHVAAVQDDQTPSAGFPAPVSSTWVDSEITGRTYYGANLLACARCALAISPSSARTSAPPRTTSSPPT